MAAKKFMIVFRAGAEPDDEFIQVFKVDKLWFDGLQPNHRGRTILVWMGHNHEIRTFVAAMKLFDYEAKMAVIDGVSADKDISEMTWEKHVRTKPPKEKNEKPV